MKTRIETLSAVHIAVSNARTKNAVSTQDNGCQITTKIINGPGPLGREVYDIITDTVIYILEQVYLSNTNVFHINSHSRGAVEAIYIANILQQIKNSLENNNTKLTAVDLFNQCNSKVRNKLIKKFNQKFNTKSHQIKNNLQNHTKTIKAIFNTIKLNIFAIDPVPGDDYFQKIPKHVFAWRDIELFTIPEIVNNYRQIIYEHERSQCFQGLIPIAANGNSNSKIIIEKMYGNHCNGSGILTEQRPKFDTFKTLGPKDKVITVKRSKPIAIGDQKYDTSAIQDLILCKIIHFMRKKSGIISYHPERIDETELYHPEWFELNIKPIKQVISNFVTKNPAKSSNKKLLDHYSRVAQLKPAMEQHICKHTYGTGPRWLLWKNEHYPRYALIGKNSRIKLNSPKTTYCNLLGIKNFVNIQHYLRQLKYDCKNLIAIYKENTDLLCYPILKLSNKISLRLFALKLHINKHKNKKNTPYIQQKICKIESLHPNINNTLSYKDDYFKDIISKPTNNSELVLLSSGIAMINQTKFKDTQTKLESYKIS